MEISMACVESLLTFPPHFSLIFFFVFVFVEIIIAAVIIIIFLASIEWLIYWPCNNLAGESVNCAPEKGKVSAPSSSLFLLLLHSI